MLFLNKFVKSFNSGLVGGGLGYRSLIRLKECPATNLNPILLQHNCFSDHVYILNILGGGSEGRGRGWDGVERAGAYIETCARWN